MTRAAQAAYFAVMALWVGGLAAISFVVAPSAFRTLPKESAGQTVGGILRTFGWVEFGCAAVALASAWFLAQGRRGWAWERIRVGALVVMLAASSFNFSITREAAVVRLKMRGTSDLWLQERFSWLHRLSVLLVSANILIGGAQLVISGARVRPPDGA